MGNKRKYLVYSLFILSVFYGAWFHFIKGNNIPKPNPLDITQTAVQSINSEDNTAYNTNASTPHLAAMELPSPPDKWGRDPFLVHNAKEIVNNNYTESNTSAEPRLTGISYHLDRPSYAIINNKVLQTNDKVEGWQIVSIFNDYVLIKKSGVTKKLMMGETL